jgi:hypothetical protein
MYGIEKLCYSVRPMARQPDETALNNVTILRSDNAAMKRIAESRERQTVLQVARQLIHYGVAHIGDVEAWYRDLAIEAARPQEGDESSPD